MRFVIDHLSKHFEKKEVLKEITFTFEEGKIYGLLGRNGAGNPLLSVLEHGYLWRSRRKPHVLLCQARY